MLSAEVLEHMICSAWGHRDAQKLIEADRREAKLEALRELRRRCKSEEGFHHGDAGVLLKMIAELEKDGGADGTK